MESGYYSPRGAKLTPTWLSGTSQQLTALLHEYLVPLALTGTCTHSLKIIKGSSVLASGLRGAGEESGQPEQLACSVQTAVPSDFGKGGCWQLGKASERNGRHSQEKPAGNWQGRVRQPHGRGCSQSLAGNSRRTPKKEQACF